MSCLPLETSHVHPGAISHTKFGVWNMVEVAMKINRTPVFHRHKNGTGWELRL